MAKYSPKSYNELKELVGDENINLGDIDTSAITDMAELFQYSKRTDFSGIEKWDTSSVTDMRYMFEGAKNFNHNINDWNVSKVTNMSCMFMEAENFNQNISMWDTSSVVDMEAIFFNAKNFPQNLDNWNNWDLTNVRKMINFSPLAYNPPKWYFEYQEAFLERWTDSDDIVDDMESEGDGIYTPKNWDELKNLVDNKFIHLGNINTSAIDSMSELFENSNRTNFDGIEKWDTSNVTSMSYMFSGAEHFNHNINDWNVSKVEIMSSMFYDCPMQDNLPDWYNDESDEDE